MRLEQMTVTANHEIAENIYEMRVMGELVQEVKSPGQFVHVRVGQDLDALLRRPISICSIDKSTNEMILIYRAEGTGTKKLSRTVVGTAVDVLGPLGNGFPVHACEAGDRALIVGGGVGVPPLYELSKQLVAKGVEVTHVLGFSDRSVVFYEEVFRELGPTFIATVDGSAGEKGFVTDIIKNKNLDYDTMFACGPTPMLSALEKGYGHKPLYISLEERMGCGIGACFACVCHMANDPTGTGYRKVCTDGPVFKAGEVVFA